MENKGLISISHTETHNYHAVEVPMDAIGIHSEKSWMGNYCLKYRISASTSFTQEIGFAFEIIGIQGGGESLTEEMAREIVESNDWDEYSKVYINRLGSLQTLNIMLESKGIKTVNPYKRPGLDGCPIIDTSVLWKHKYNQWQQAESELSKIVIIKSKK